MKTRYSELEQRYLLLFKIDAKNLFDRIYNRREDYIEIFSLKRNRSVFREIFSSRYEKASMFDLSHCPAEVIETLNQFHNNADQIYWYLKHTQDMPNTIEDEITRKVASLKKNYEMLELYVDAALSGEDEPTDEVYSFDEIPHTDSHEEYFHLDGELKDIEQELEFIQPEVYSDLDEEDHEEDEKE